MPASLETLWKNSVHRADYKGLPKMVQAHNDIVEVHHSVPDSERRPVGKLPLL